LTHRPVGVKFLEGNDAMPPVQVDILNAFYEKLSKSESIDAATVDALRKALASDKKLKADDFVAILTRKKGTASAP
jgi:hypothetical protein